MNIDRISNRIAAVFAALAGCAWIATGATQITAADQVRVSDDFTFITHVSLGLMTFALLASIPAVLKLASFARSPRGGYMAAVGLGLLGVAATTTNFVGHDPAFFLVVAPIANLLWLAGSIWLAVSLSKAGRVPRWVAIGLPLVQIVALPLSFIGGGIVAGAWWIATSLILNEGATEVTTATSRTEAITSA